MNICQAVPHQPDGYSQKLSSGFLHTPLFSLPSQLGGQVAGANWGKAGVLMWNLIEMCRWKVSSGAECWLCPVLNDCSLRCLSASPLPADNRMASTTAWQRRRKVTLPLHHLHCVKYHYIRQGADENLNLGFWMRIQVYWWTHKQMQTKRAVGCMLKCLLHKKAEEKKVLNRFIILFILLWQLMKNNFARDACKWRSAEEECGFVVAEKYFGLHFSVKGTQINYFSACLHVIFAFPEAAYMLGV